MKRILLTLVTMVFCAMCCVGQELKCTVSINTENISGSNKDMYKELEMTLSDLLNNHKWSDAVFQKEEKIECVFSIHLDASSASTGGLQKGAISVTASRPVFNTSYSTPLFSFNDKDLTFTYSPDTRLEIPESDYDPNQNLMAVLTFYVNVILGVEFDSYASLGGASFFEKAENIASMARSSDDEGWKALSKEENRYSLISAYMDANLANLHNVYYEYHRLGLDVMADDVNKGKAKILEQMTYLREMQRSKPYSPVLKIFVETKFDELYNMYRLDDQKTREEVYSVVKAILPTLRDAEKLQKGN